MFHLGSVRFSRIWGFQSFIGAMYSRCCLLTQLGRCSGMKSCCSFLLFCGACFRVLVLSAMEKLEPKFKGLFSNRGCLGCITKIPAIISMDEASVGLRTQGQALAKDNRSEDFWSSSAFEIDQCAALTRSISSIGMPNHPSDPQSSGGMQTDPPEFVNHGLVLWNQIRQQWVGNNPPQRRTQVGEPRISWNATYESLLGTSKPFPQRIRLDEMVDFLVDIWELEGLYD